MTARVCPACQRRRGGVIPPDCPICHGNGTLPLGDGAVHHHGADVTARAIELALESTARFTLAIPDITPDLAQQALTVGVQDLIKAHLIGKGFQAAMPIARRPLHPSVVFTLDAPPLEWERHERPLAAGIPGFSAAGYIARLARIADPADLLGPSTSERADQRGAEERRALYLAAASTNHP